MKPLVAIVGRPNVGKSMLFNKLVGRRVSIVEGTREQSSILHGASPRGTLALMRVSKAYAMGKGRDYVVPEDIKETAVPVLAHRLVLSQRRGGSQAARKAVQDILGSVPVPTEEWKR